MPFGAIRPVTVKTESALAHYKRQAAHNARAAGTGHTIKRKIKYSARLLRNNQYKAAYAQHYPGSNQHKAFAALNVMRVVG